MSSIEPFVNDVIGRCDETGAEKRDQSGREGLRDWNPGKEPRKQETGKHEDILEPVVKTGDLQVWSDPSDCVHLDGLFLKIT